MTAIGTALSVRDLSVSLRGSGRPMPLVAGVDLDVRAGTVTALIGESGSGKSLTASSLLGLLPGDVYAVSAERLAIGTTPIRPDRAEDFRKVRGRVAGYVTQDPSTALDPTMTVGDQIAEIFVAHRGATMEEARREAVRMLDLVRIPSAEQRARDYPQAFSGGMRQRVVIAGAVALSPVLLVADEPTTALDVTVQAEILALIDDLRRQLGTGVLLITHDLALVYQVADAVEVMYGGRIVERGPAETICTRPRHPYTAGLLASVPDLDDQRATGAPIPGSPPALGAGRNACAFAPRCDRARQDCRESLPAMAEVGALHALRCFHPLG
jgi:oligopeptide/dipeptide ABC transporter ATP-binding protein